MRPHTNYVHNLCQPVLRPKLEIKIKHSKERPRTNSAFRQVLGIYTYRNEFVTVLLYLPQRLSKAKF